MNFGLSEEQLLLKSTLRRFLDEQCPSTRVRAVMEGESGHDPGLWGGLAGLGIPGLIIPPQHGGSGLELLDLSLAAEELGYGATPGPFLGNAMATVALIESDDEEQRARWLPGIASGELLLTTAFGEDEGRWSPDQIVTRAKDGALEGDKPFVPYAAQARAMLVAARDDDGPGIWIVEADAPGLTSQSLRVVDATRRLHAVRLRGARATKLRGGARALERALDAGSVLVAADAYGGARRCLDMTAGYALQREQFGQVIGGFQAVKHQLANLACELEPALSLWWYAAHAFDRIQEQSARHASLAKALLCDLFDRATRDCTELHGGIGFTWEYDLQLWFRRAIFDRGFGGDAAFHRARAADLAGW